METNHRKPVTITDIARQCKVSTATVSRVLSQTQYPVSSDIRERVFETASKLGYSSNLAAKAYKQGNNKSIGIIVPSLQNSFFVQMVNGISQQALSMGFVPHIFCSQRNLEYERNAINQFLQSRIMGLLIESIDKNPKCLKNYISHGGKVCLFDSNFSDHIKSAMYSETDSYQTSKLAIDYLVACGHQKIAVISAPLEKLSRKVAIQGCIDTCRDRKIDFDVKEDIYLAQSGEESESNMYEFQTGRELAKNILKKGKKYSAVLALNDHLAIGAISQFKLSGFNVPKDISVMGMDDIPMGQIYSPALTTVHVSSELKGKSACQILINTLQNNEEECELNITVKPRVIERDSVRDMRK